MIRIALADDLPIILEGLKVLINQIDDFSVVAEFKNGKELVDGFVRCNADIILTDIDMPVMNGVEATHALMALHPDTKIIALSMYNDHLYYYNMILAGAKGFVLKQSSVTELEHAIREVYAGGSFFSKELLHGVIITMQNSSKKQLGNKTEQTKLNERDLDLLRLLCQGLQNNQIAEKLFVSVKTIESNKAKLMQKTNTQNSAGLIIWAIKNKLVEV